jgi:hypothetical protein
MTAPAADLFAFWEADLVKSQGRFEPSIAGALSPIGCALELAPPEWSEQEAGAELGRLFSRQELHAAESQLLAQLAHTPFLDKRGIRAARVLRVAAAQVADGPAAPKSAP